MLFPEFKELGLPELLCILAGLGFVMIVVSYLINYLPLSSFKNVRFEANQNEEAVSIIICARNEEDNLAEFLPKVLSQEYYDYEVIVVNDCSEDNTENVIDEFANIFPHLRKVNIKEDEYYKHGKKFAMLVGIKAARHNRLLLTDADCFPASNDWLKEMVSGFSDKWQIVLGYGAYQKQKGFLNKLIRFDAFIIAVQYLSAAIKKQAYMGVGRNLAYTKDLFFKEKAFSKHYHIASGDDDLFINQAAKEDNVNVCVSKEVITYSKPKQIFLDWRLQKARHMTTSPLYSAASKRKITFAYFAQYYFHIASFAMFASFQTLLLIPIVLVLKMIVQWLILNQAAKKLNEKDLLFGSMLYELILLFIYPIFHITKLFYKPNTWNR